MDELDEQLQQLQLINGRIQEQQLQHLHQQNVIPETKNVTRLVQSIEGGQRNLNSNKCNVASIPVSSLPTTPSTLRSTSLITAKNLTSPYNESKCYEQSQPQQQKKIGPIVPPKPNKKSLMHPTDYDKYATPVLLRKNQCSSGSSSSGLGIDQQISSIVTLDNPLVLEQQLEALEYHKKQLEKRNKLPQQQQQKCRTLLSPLCTIPKLSSTSLLSASSFEVDVKHNKIDKKGQYSLVDNSTYANMPSVAQQQQQHQKQYQQQQPIKDFNNVYSNIMTRCNNKALEHVAKGPSPNTATTIQLSDNMNLPYLIAGTATVTPLSAHGSHNNTIYTNLLYDKQSNAQGEIFTSLPTPSSATLISNHGNGDDDEIGNGCCKNDGTKEVYNVSHEDELLPPPPSPVSSSYSELRRASETFKARQIINNSKHNNNHCNSSNTNQIMLTNESVHMAGHHSINQMQSAVPQRQQEQPLPVQLPGMTGDKFTFYGDNAIYGNEYKNYNTQMGQNNSALNAVDYYGGGYGGFSQSSSCYESIYEPINPRPPSQLSSNVSNNFIMYNSGADIKNGCGSVNTNDGNVGFLSKSKSSNLTSLDSGGGIGSCSDSNPSTYSNNININNHGQGTNLVYRTSLSSPSSSLEDNMQTLSKHFIEQSMDGGGVGRDIDRDGSNSQDLESYGICYKCQQRVMGENSGCTAMDQIYHITCFTCVQCQINLQGKAFYALEGKPYCEYDYLQTLEKCSVCVKPILERILRATGKPYHPQCFTCVVCMKSLDGIPFTVDATNQNYCIEDFHKKFAPRCCVCKNPIMPEPGEEETVRVVALDRSFHFECYKCEDCGLLLSSEAEGRGCYPLDDHVLCKSCNAKRVQMLTSRMITEL